MNKNNVENLKAQLRGKLIQPGDAEYDESRRVYNGMINRSPRYITYCMDVGDVIAAVHFGRENGIRTSVRGGGHNAGGLGICNDGLVIDLSNINYTHPEPADKTILVGGGSVWAQVDHATHAFGMAVPSGIYAGTGVGGLTLGGGGNFGVVTSFKFRMHEVSMVYAGPMLWEMDRAEEVMQWYRDYILAAPEGRKYRV